MASQLEIYNQALVLALSRTTLTDVNARRPEADICNLWYPLVRQNILKAASWPSAKKNRRLALIKERDFGEEWAIDDPAPGYAYVYGVPSDMMAPRYLHSYNRFEVEWYEPQNTNALMTNDASAILHYTFDQDNPTYWDPALTMAVVFALAAHITLPLNGKPAVAQQLANEAELRIQQAQTDVANEADDYHEALPEALEARGYAQPTTRPQYFFPYETFNGVTA